MNEGIKLESPTVSPSGLPPVPCSAFVLRLFPSPCKPKKKHECRLCDRRIQPGELCCRWTGFSDGPFTSHAHPECYAATEKWDHGDWECCLQGDLERPPVRMYWPNAAGQAATNPQP